MKGILFFLTTAVSVAALADGAATGARRPPKASAEERAAEREEELRETGGRLDCIPDGPTFVIADARESPSDNAPGRVAEVIRGMLKIAATNVADSVSGSPFEAALRLRKGHKALMAVLVCAGDVALPALAVYPEERVAVVNATAATRFASGAEGEVRIIKECWRGIGFIAGAGYSANNGSVMQPIGSPLELDAVEWQVISPMQFQQMGKFLNKYGAKRGRRTTYRRAVEEGWAPPPTNDYQRVIWDAAHSSTNTPAKQ